MRPRPTPAPLEAAPEIEFPIAGHGKPPRKATRKRREPRAEELFDDPESASLDDPESILNPEQPPPKAFIEGRLSLRTVDDVLSTYEEVANATAQGAMPPKVTEAMAKLLGGASALVQFKERPKMAGAGMSVTFTGAPQGAGGPFAVFAGMSQQPALPPPSPQVPVIDLAAERREELAEFQARKS